MMHSYHIGCSGYYYAYWKNRFYPRGLAAKEWLHYYSTVFNSVELNGTFYRTPKLADLQRYATVTEKDFRFSVKMNKLITHNKKLKGMKQDIEAQQDLVREGLGNKLNCFLFQMPPSFHYNEENIERIVENIPHRKENVIELRHASWWNDEVKKIFNQHHFTFCNVDIPGIETYFIHTSDIFYLRLHGKPELFKSPYSTAKLAEFYRQFPKTMRQYNVFFNNTFYEAGYQNALELMEMIKIKR